MWKIAVIDNSTAIVFKMIVLQPTVFMRCYHLLQCCPLSLFQDGKAPSTGSGAGARMANLGNSHAYLELYAQHLYLFVENLFLCRFLGEPNYEYPVAFTEVISPFLPFNLSRRWWTRPPSFQPWTCQQSAQRGQTQCGDLWHRLP